MTSSMINTLNGIVGAGTPVVSVAPTELSAPNRPVPLEVRVSAPATGANLPIVGSPTATGGTSTATRRSPRSGPPAGSS